MCSNTIIENLKYDLWISSLQGANIIKRIEGMSRLTGLSTLHLRDNQLESLDGFAEEQKNLQYINLRWDMIIKRQHCIHNKHEILLLLLIQLLEDMTGSILDETTDLSCHCTGCVEHYTASSVDELISSS